MQDHYVLELYRDIKLRKALSSAQETLKSTSVSEPDQTANDRGSPRPGSAKVLQKLKDELEAEKERYRKLEEMVAGSKKRIDELAAKKGGRASGAGDGKPRRKGRKARVTMNMAASSS